MKWSIHILDKSDELAWVEDLQRKVWPGSETDVVPAAMLLAAVHGGGIVIGAFAPAPEDPGEFPARPQGGGENLVGAVFGFPGFYHTADGPRLKHCSHMLGVLPEYRSQGLGFVLKRAQWQMVRKQGIDRITWTYDPLLSLNAFLNISRLGAVCNTYLPNFYGDMRDGLNAGLPSDRFEVDWWVNSQRVNHRLSRRARRKVDLLHMLAAGAKILNEAWFDRDDWPHPNQTPAQPNDPPDTFMLVEIPADFLALKAANLELALEWRLHSRALFIDLFQRGYLATDFIYQTGPLPRSYYVFTHGDSTL